MSNLNWHPASWRDRPIVQQPEWPDSGRLEEVLEGLRRQPPLIFAGEALRLRQALARVAQGSGFLLQAGDCAETFDAFSSDTIRNKLKVILQMAVVLTYGGGLPVVKVGRIAGQFAKPRSSGSEIRQGQTLPAYRGDIVNGLGFNAAERTPNPERLFRAYNQAASTLNLLRALTQGGFADLLQVQAWNQAFVAHSSAGQRYDAMAREIGRALQFMGACGVDLSESAEIHRADFYVSHEALLLSFEEAMVRQDPATGASYDTSAHLLWIGERTRQLDGAHVEFMRGIGNPIGLKLGPTVSSEDALALCERLDPDRTPGRLTLITRMGMGKIEQSLPPLLRAIKASGHPVVWACDPMHGNTITGASGHKTRRFDDVLAEVRGFFGALRGEGMHPGGIHVELTGEDVTECLGGAEEIVDEQLGQRYETACDPRLNGGQSLELAFQISEMLRT